MLPTPLRDRRLRALLTLTAVLFAFTSVAALASSKSVKVFDSSYSTTKLTVGKGTKVTWKWASSLRHNVVVKKGPAKFRSRIQVRGTFSHTFTKKGKYSLYCTLHPYMKMTIIVR